MPQKQVNYVVNPPSLTDLDKTNVRQTWALIKQDIHGNAFDFFIRFFEDNPEYQKHFKQFKDVPSVELKGNKKLLAHATGVLYAISMLVDNLDDPELLVEMLSKLARNHRRRAIDYQQFVAVRRTLLALMSDKFGPEVITDQVVDGWTKAYDVILSVIGPLLDDDVDDDNADDDATNK